MKEIKRVILTGDKVKVLHQLVFHNADVHKVLSTVQLVGGGLYRLVGGGEQWECSSTVGIVIRRGL